MYYQMKWIESLKNKQSLFSLIGLILILLIIWNGFLFYDLIKEDEQQRMEIWTAAQESLNKASVNDASKDLSLELEIIKSNDNIPMIITNENDNILSTYNLPKNIKGQPEKVKDYFAEVKLETNRIEIDLSEDNKQFVYYDESSVLKKIKWYPLILLLIIILFSIIAFYFFKTSKDSEQNKLWAGMAKETAHQIGTPLSSLLGWVELLKTDENMDQTYVKEIKKDVDRLQRISQRFSKVGSQIELEEADVVEVTKNAIQYLKSRSSSLIDFKVKLPDHQILVPLNKTLYSWTIENLTKNATDAMSGKGKLDVEITEDDRCVRVLITDTGKGIAARLQQKIFNPGYTEKKRGWGLGLSLAKRIIKDYHKGSISVYKSLPGKGTTMMIKLKK